MRTARQALVAICCLLGVALAAAQPDNPITVAPINYGGTVSETITEAGIYDWWVFSGQPGDALLIEMRATDGLAPLLGLLGPSRAMVARSPAGQANETITLAYTLEQPGEYTIVATRAGNMEGVTTGAYDLTLTATRVEPAATPDRFRQVVFDCNSSEAANVLTLTLEEDPNQTEALYVTVYGLDGFQPALRTQLELDFEPFFDDFCYRNIDGDGPGWGEGDRLLLPGEDALEITQEAVKTNFVNVDLLNEIQLNVGAYDNTSGTFIVVIDGFVIGPGGDRDLLEIGLGPLAREDSLRIYAVSDKATRLDTYLEHVNENLDPLQTCDDAGRRDCDDVLPLNGFEMYSVEFDKVIQGGAFDAGLRLSPGTPDQQRVLAGAFNGRTEGAYALVIVGEYSGRDSD